MRSGTTGLGYGGRMDRVCLGPFRLVEPLARGGMGEVWRGAHEATGLPVAVKLLPRELASDPSSRRQLTQEIRAVAALDHPHIIAVLDAGTTTEEAAAASAGQISPGVPWVAMELASGGSLHQRRPGTFSELKEALEQVLDALAHAHSRGLVHRDLKPGNLLRGARRDARPGLKLSDFGLAQSLDETMVGEASAGTPAYMAPEQILGRAHQVGPWSDLYALGCLGWWGATGDAPFARPTALATARAALSEALPDFSPRFPCPDAFEDWLRALLARGPADRPQRAADALHALREIIEHELGELGEEDEQTASFGRPVVSPEAPTQHGFDFDEDLLDAPLAGLSSPPVHGIGPPPSVGPWQRAMLERPTALLGAGVGLLAAREPPLAGRTTAQDALWEELRLVHATREARAVVVRGEVGVGKTALGRWLAARADEVGAARCWSVRDEPRALEASVERWLRLREVDPGERSEVLFERLGDREQAATVAALLDGRLGRLGRRGALRQLVVRAAESRPLLWWGDDAQRHPEALALANDLLALEVPVLVVLGVSDDDLAQRDAASMLLDHLDATTVELTPLPMPARRRLLDGLLGLESSLAEAVAARSGHPAWLVQLVRAWAQRGQLVSGPRGLQLVQGATLELPEGLDQTWLRRVEEVLDQLEPAAGWDLHVAAALGPSLEEATWHTACDDPEGQGMGWSEEGVARRHDLVQAMMDAGLLRGRRTLRFAHGMLHRALVDQARRMGRSPWLHHACAQALRIHGVDDAARMGRHLLRAGHPIEAIGPLLEGVASRVAQRPGEALEVLLTAEEAAHSASLSPTDPVSGALLVTRAEVHLALAEPTEALRWCRWTQQAVQTHGVEDAAHWEAWHRHLVRALWVEHDAFLALHSPDESLVTLRRLEPAVRRIDHGAGLGEVWLAQGRLLVDEPGRQREAAALLSDALHMTDDGAARARVLLELGRLYLNGGRADDAMRMADDALSIDLPSSPGLRGELLALAGELGLVADEPGAAERLAQAVAVLDSVGRDATRPRLLSAAANLEHEGGRALRAVRAVQQELPRRDPCHTLACLTVALGEAQVRRWAAAQDALRTVASIEGAAEIWVAERLRACAQHVGFPQLADRVRGLQKP